MEWHIWYKELTPYFGPKKIHPDWEEVERSCREFFARHKFFEGEGSEKRKQKYEVHRVTMWFVYTYANGIKERVIDMNEFSIWAAFYDDMLEKLEKDEHQKYMDWVFDIAAKNKIVSTDDGFPPLMALWSDVWQRISKKSPLFFKEQFLRVLKQYIEFTAYNSIFRKQNKLPTFAEYSVVRLMDAGSNLCFYISEYVTDKFLPLELKALGLFVRLQNEADAILPLTNDIIGFKKDSLKKKLNLVIAMKEEGNIKDERVLFEKAAARLRDHFAAFRFLKNHIANQKAVNRSLNDYIENLEIMFDGNYHWVFYSGRYDYF